MILDKINNYIWSKIAKLMPEDLFLIEDDDLEDDDKENVDGGEGKTKKNYKNLETQQEPDSSASIQLHKKKIW
jgi:hypothetical protein